MILQVLRKVPAVIVFTAQHWREALILTLAVLVIFGGWRYDRLKKQHDELTGKAAKLEEDLKSKVTVQGTRVEYVYRKTDGTVTSGTAYVPPDGGSVVVKQKDYDAIKKELDAAKDKLKSAIDPLELKKLKDRIAELERLKGTPPDIIIKDKGFTLRPGLGMVYSSKFLINPEFKWCFIKRYSCLIGGNAEYVNLGVSRHVDDLLSFTGLQFNNLELEINSGPAYSGGLRVGGGLRSSF